MVPRLIARLALIVPLVAVVAVACEHAGATGPVLGSLASLTVTPNPQVLAIGGTQTFTAVGKDANGNVVPVTPTWSVVAGGGTNVAALFTAGTVSGTFANTVKATSGTISAFATVTVTSGVLASITVQPNPVALGTSASQPFVAVGKDASGNVIPIPLPGPTWTVAAGHAGGTILSPSGVYTAPAVAGVGFDTIKATSGAIVGVARANITASGALVSIAVTPNPANVQTNGTQQFTATGFDNTGLVVPTPGLAWSVVPAVGGGTITTPAGLYTAGAVVGLFTNSVKATSGAVSGYATVNVTAIPPVGPSLGTAQTYGLLAGSAFTCAGAPGTINADAAVWPGSAFTGFPP
jgi:hypothetical protein